MAPQHKDGGDGPEYPQESSSPLLHLAVKRPAPPPPPAPPALPAPPPPPPSASMAPPPLPSVASGTTEATSAQYTRESKGPPSGLPPNRPSLSWTTLDIPFLGGKPESETGSPATTPAPLWSGSETPQLTSSPGSPATINEALSSGSQYGYRGGPPDWAKGKVNHGGMYAAAAITPIVVLAVVGGLLLFCMRKRKRHQENVAAEKQKVEEMRMQRRPSPTARPYMAPPLVASPPYTAPPGQLPATPTPSVPQPVILGPIPTGANGAYFTGIDTSDVVSITSTNNLRPAPPNPFSDNDSLAEPPPPYRPRSAAPPSFANTSRQSSFRASVPPSATSRTHLIERSPFEDPIDDDAVSEISGPTRRCNGDTMSAVSDLSYQNDPVVTRTPL